MKKFEPPIKELKKWIKALRSGEFKQTTGELETKIKKESSYCCLGVACVLFIPKEKRQYDLDGSIAGGEPSYQENAPVWLKRINEDVQDKLGDVGLIELNDDLKYNFNEIADILELIYIHKAL